MLEDKLNQVQHIRLECLAQANVHVGFGKSPEDVVAAAKTFEAYITKKGT